MSSDNTSQDGWVSYSPDGDFSVTLFLFAWALMPVGFMGMLLAFHRYETFRFAVAAISLGLLLLAYLSGITQRVGTSRDRKVQLTIGVLSFATLSFAAVWFLDLEQWWWVSYGLIIGCVPMMYVSLDALSGSNADGWKLAWPVAVHVPESHLSSWRILSARWKTGLMAWTYLAEGQVAVLYGAKDGEVTSLHYEVLCSADAQPEKAATGLDFAAIGSLGAAQFGEE
ncbi:MAG: hypothetical protein ISP83_07015 [Candidatus Poseidonia sp.]|nr:hypothetical protein [Poseidonia sp.]MBL6747903.1 hypothetical protein [Poseidonia sp.]MBL6807325.1 hypothetical protein [Poseidonia sp.]MBL6886296.1 hypothetical protein [Poseidonia sp.]MBL6892878.1 hypothetical protein [Poseidonia sp.]